jgi:hypothetical protein
MKKLILAVCCIGLLSACKSNVDANPKPAITSVSGAVEKISEAPDGTILWRSKIWHEAGWWEDVYFSSGGTRRVVPSGKSSRVAIVPNSDCR